MSYIGIEERANSNQLLEQYVISLGLSSCAIAGVMADLSIRESDGYRQKSFPTMSLLCYL